MTQQGSYPSSARDAYDAMAPIYDRFNEANDYEVWLGEALLPELEKHGLRMGQSPRPYTSRVLDVGCGTGQAIPPLTKRGWSYWGCDTSSEMLLRAHEKPIKGWAALFDPVDARALPRFRPGPFDLVLLLNDVVNYLTEDGDLERCFSGVKRNLAEGGLVCFDANTLGCFESAYTRNGVPIDASAAPVTERGWAWTGLTADPQPGGIFEAELAGKGVEAHIHRERHWTPEVVADAMAASGLKPLAILGQREADGMIHLDPEPVEQKHYKLVYIGGHRG